MGESDITVLKSKDEDVKIRRFLVLNTAIYKE